MEILSLFPNSTHSSTTERIIRHLAKSCEPQKGFPGLIQNLHSRTPSLQGLCNLPLSPLHISQVQETSPFPISFSTPPHGLTQHMHGNSGICWLRDVRLEKDSCIFTPSLLETGKPGIDLRSQTSNVQKHLKCSTHFTHI